MYDLNAIEAIFGVKLTAYIKRKSKGGAAGQKGTRYEDRFALLKIGEAMKAAFEKTGNFSDEDDSSFFTQSPCFVDDLVVVSNTTKVAEHYQLKNQMRTRWGRGSKSIASDFRYQLRLGRAQGVDTEVTLVVNTEVLAKRLKVKRPRTLRSHVYVCFFPPATTLSELLEYEPMRRSIEEFLGPDPTDDHLVTVGKLMQGAWAESGSTTTLKELLSELHRSGVPLLRPMNSVPDIPQELKNILDSIPNFEYRLERGFLRWWFGSSDSGCFSKHCGTKEFTAFTRRVLNRNPNTFESLELELG